SAAKKRCRDGQLLVGSEFARDAPLIVLPARRRAGDAMPEAGPVRHIATRRMPAACSGRRATAAGVVPSGQRGRARAHCHGQSESLHSINPPFRVGVEGSVVAKGCFQRISRRTPACCDCFECCNRRAAAVASRAAAQCTFSPSAGAFACSRSIASRIRCQGTERTLRVTAVIGGGGGRTMLAVEPC